MLDYIHLISFERLALFCYKLIVDPTNLVQFKDESTVNLLPAERQTPRYFKRLIHFTATPLKYKSGKTSLMSRPI